MPYVPKLKASGVKEKNIKMVKYLRIKSLLKNIDINLSSVAPVF